MIYMDKKQEHMDNKIIKYHTFTIEPVTDMPSGKYESRQTLYSTIINQFIESKQHVSVIKSDMVSMVQLYARLRYFVQKRNLTNIKVFMRVKDVYMENTDMKPKEE